jgi:hypothetical protein
MLIVFLVRLSLAWKSLAAHRLIQYHTNSTNSTVLGSIRVTMDHEIATFTAKPSSKHAVFVPLASADIETVTKHLNATSPVIFLVDSESIDTSDLENLLTATSHKAPIYFSYDTVTLPEGFTHVKTSDARSNSAIKKTRLQNVIGTINSSSTSDRQRIAVITAPLDSFSVVPTAQIGANNNGLAAVSLLEIMHQLSKFPIANNWVFVFALTDGHFCHFEGLEKVINTLTSGHVGKIEFGLSLESVTSPRLNGVFGQRIKRDSAFAKFMLCLIDAMKTAGVPFETALGESFRTQKVFSKSLVQSVAVANEDFDDSTHITDRVPDVNRSNAIVWAVADALLRTMYDADATATIVERHVIDTAHWARVVAKLPRVAAFRDQAAAQVFAQWMRKFGTVSVEEWSSGKCFAPYSSTSATLTLYTPTPASQSVALFVGAALYGGLVWLAIVGIAGVRKIFA